MTESRLVDKAIHCLVINLKLDVTNRSGNIFMRQTLAVGLVPAVKMSNLMFID